MQTGELKIWYGALLFEHYRYQDLFQSMQNKNEWKAGPETKIEAHQDFKKKSNIKLPNTGNRLVVPSFKKM